MPIFQSQHAITLYAKMHEYTITGRIDCLPVITNIIRENPPVFFTERDNTENTLFYHLLHLPQLAIPARQFTIRCNLLHALSLAGINSVNAIMMMMQSPVLLHQHLQQLLTATNHNFLSAEKMMWYLTNRDTSRKTPIETAIESRNSAMLTTYLQTLRTWLFAPRLLAFSKTHVGSGANLLEYIEIHADIHMLLAYIHFLDNAFGSTHAFAILFEQATGKSQGRALLNNLDKTGSHHLNGAIAVLQSIDNPEKKWQNLWIIQNASLNLPQKDAWGTLNFRLFSPPMLPCDTGEAIEAAAEIEEKTEQNWLPTGLLDTTESELQHPSLRVSQPHL
jgi:hypothetical protein